MGIKLLKPLSKRKVDYLFEEFPGPQNIIKVKTKAKLCVTETAESGNEKKKSQEVYTTCWRICVATSIRSFRK
jgi:hypothetical protein